MPRVRSLKVLTEKEIATIPEFSKKKKFMKLVPATKLESANAVRTSIEKWSKSLKAPVPSKPQKIRIKALRFTEKDLNKLATIHTSKYSIAEMMYQKLPPSNLVSLVYSSHMAYTYYKMKQMYKKKVENKEKPAAELRKGMEKHSIIRDRIL